MGNNVQHAPEKTINGTFGEVWIDDYYAAETTGLESKVTLEKTEVNQTGIHDGTVLFKDCRYYRRNTDHDLLYLCTASGTDGLHKADIKRSRCGSRSR